MGAMRYLLAGAIAGSIAALMIRHPSPGTIHEVNDRGFEAHYDARAPLPADFPSSYTRLLVALSLYEGTERHRLEDVRATRKRDLESIWSHCAALARTARERGQLAQVEDRMVVALR